MSRRGKEFNHRTAVFEGAFRAWSHLGGLSLELLQTKSAQELDPITFVIENDTRPLGKAKTPPINEDGSPRREYPYETLPRSGLLHPFVKAVLTQWLGTGVEREALEIGLGTLRCWWQHRRKGENKTSVKTLGSDKMRDVLDQYTRHFFEIAHCLVLGDNVEAPRTLKRQISDLEKKRREQAVDGTLSDSDLSPLERMFKARAVAKDVTPSSSSSSVSSATGGVSMHGKCLPGNLDLPEVVLEVNRKAALVAYRGKPTVNKDKGPTPMVYCSSNGDCQILMHIQGITCAHCVKIVETVLKGCHGSKSPINGLLDAAADRDLNGVLIKIDNPSSAPRIAYEAARNLKLVGYTGRAQEVEWKAGSRVSVFAEAAHHESPVNFFDWTAPCTCPDSGVFRGGCARHGQLTSDLEHAMSAQEALVTALLQQGEKVKTEPPVQEQQQQQHTDHELFHQEPLALRGDHHGADSEVAHLAYQHPRGGLQAFPQQPFQGHVQRHSLQGRHSLLGRDGNLNFSIDEWEPLYGFGDDENMSQV